MVMVNNSIIQGGAERNASFFGMSAPAIFKQSRLFP